MRRSRLLPGTGYGLATLLVVLPVLERIITLLPLQPGRMAWRLQALGVLSQTLVLPLAGFAVAVVTAYVLEHRKVMRGLAGAAFLGVLLLAAAMLQFVLDLLQYRGAVPVELADYYRAAGAVYLATLVLSAAFLGWIGIAAWRSGRRPRRRRGRVQRYEDGEPRREADDTASDELPR